MYQFGLFDELRMHGVPSSGIRFPELVLVRGSYSFNLFGLYRLDLFVDHARGRDPNNRTVWRPVTGTGAAITLKAPWNTMFTADVGKSFMPDIVPRNRIRRHAVLDSEALESSMKADLHVHSYHSGYARHFHWLRARECYSTPDDIYRVAKARGMDLVCITDHDSIDGCLEFLDRHPDAPDFIAGEEISCLVPDAPGLRIHLGALGMTEAVHREAQRLRDNVFETAAYLRRERVFFVMNHLFMLFDDQMAVETYVRRALTLAPGLETRNGAMLAEHNEFVAELAALVSIGRRLASRRRRQRCAPPSLRRHDLHRDARAALASSSWPTWLTAGRGRRRRTAAAAGCSPRSTGRSSITGAACSAWSGTRSSGTSAHSRWSARRCCCRFSSFLAPSRCE